MLLHVKGPNFNAVREQYQRLAAVPHSRFAIDAFIQKVEDLSTRLDKEFPNRFDAAKKTVTDDIAWLRQAVTDKYGKDNIE